MLFRSKQKESSYYSKTLGKVYSRRDTWLKHLAFLLQEYYFVNSIWINRSHETADRDGLVLEVSGTAENVLMAEYVYYFVLNHIEASWKSLTKTIFKKSQAGRLSYYEGVVAGFNEKLEAQRQQVMTDSSEATALITSGNIYLKDYISLRYPNLRTKTTRTVDRRGTSAYQLGHSTGKSLTINKPVSNASKSGKLLR